jgi:hypothetical protein
MTTDLQPVNVSEHPEVQINENFETLSAVGVFGKRQPATLGLVWGYYGGLFRGNTVANGTVTLTDSSANYVVANRSTGAVSVSTATTNWNDAAYARLYKVTASGGLVTGVEDHRFGINGFFSRAEDVAETLGVALIYGKRQAVTTGLTWGYYGGIFKANTVADGTVALTDNSANYIVVNRSTGAVSVSTATTNWTSADYARVYKVTTVSGAVTAVEDHRRGQGGVAMPEPQCIPIACSDESTALTAGTAKVTFRMPFAFKLLAVRGSLTTAQATGSIFTVDINESGTTVISTKLTIDNTEKTSTTAATPAVISDADIADDAEITIDIDQIGDGTAKGLKVYLIGLRA